MGSCHCKAGSTFFSKLNLTNIALLKPGMYRPPRKTYCQTCHFTCRDCNGSSRSHCTSCLQHGGFTNGVCECNPGYYRYGIDDPCDPCTVGCIKCENRGSCQECNAKEGWAKLDLDCACDSQRGFFKSGNQCSCQSGFLANTIDGVTTCQSCTQKFGAGCLDCT